MRHIPGYSKIKKSVKDVFAKIPGDDKSAKAGLLQKLAKFAPKAAKIGTAFTIIDDLSSTGYMAMGVGAEFAAIDPPAQDYKTPTTPQIPHGPVVKLSGRTLKSLAAAANAMSSNVAQFVGQIRAMVKANERFRGAVQAHDRAAEQMQAVAVARFAQAAARALDGNARLRSSLAHELLKVLGSRFEVTAKGQALLERDAKRNGTPAELTMQLRSFGLDIAITKRETRALEARLARAKPSAPIVVPDFLASAVVTAREGKLSASLRDWASRASMLGKALAS
jgi:hypothetical protein